MCVLCWGTEAELAFVARLGTHSFQTDLSVRQLLEGYLRGLQYRDPARTGFDIEVVQQAAWARLDRIDHLEETA